MKKYTKFSSNSLIIRTENIDTDQIVPARFLRLTTKEGFGKFLFYDWRFDKNGKQKKDSLFRGLPNKNVKILITGNNFGCGSSREHAVWALKDFGFDVIISSSFGDIFYNNSLKNGLLPVVLKRSELDKLFGIIEEKSNSKITVDLEIQQMAIDNYFFSFPMDNFRKTCLLKGIDELGYVLSFEQKIREFENQHRIYLIQK